MTNREQEGPLNNLPYFISWGGEAAALLARAGFDEFIGHDLFGKRLLEIGAFGGKMSSLFALLGAEVTGVDMESGFAVSAAAEARIWGVADRVNFLESPSGSLSILPNGFFDLAFTKSVLLHIRDLESFMHELSPKLKPGGRVCFLENPCRNVLDGWVRNLVHLKQGKPNYDYMNAKRIAAIGRVFDLEIVRLRMNPLFTSRTPGWYLICGHRRPEP
jgi:SAM-dependent methyltransferase